MVASSSWICKLPSGLSGFYLFFCTLSLFGVIPPEQNGATPAMAAALTGPVGTQMLMANLCALALMMVTLWPAGKSAATIKVNCLMWSGFAFFWSLVIIPYNIKTGQMTGDRVIPYHVFNLGSGAACLYAFATMTEEKAKK